MVINGNASPYDIQLSVQEFNKQQMGTTHVQSSRQGQDHRRSNRRYPLETDSVQVQSEHSHPR